MNPIVESLLEFNKAFEIPYLTKPGLSSDDLIELRIKLLTEEVQEYAEGSKQRSKTAGQHDNKTATKPPTNPPTN